MIHISRNANTTRFLQQVMKKKKKTSWKCYYATYYLMRGASILLPCLQVTYSFNSARCFTSLCLAFESLPIQYKVSLMMIGAQISHRCIQSSQNCFCDVSSLLVHHTQKKNSQTLNKGYKMKKMWWYWEQLEEHMGTYDYIWEHHMEHIESHLKLEEYIWEQLAYLQEFLKISKNSHQHILFPKREKPFELVPAWPHGT